MLWMPLLLSILSGCVDPTDPACCNDDDSADAPSFYETTPEATAFWEPIDPLDPSWTDASSLEQDLTEFEPPVDYVESAVWMFKGYAYGGWELFGSTSTGTRCATATDPVACEAAWEARQPSGEGLAPCPRMGEPERRWVYHWNRGDEWGVIGDLDGLLGAFEPINTLWGAGVTLAADRWRTDPDERSFAPDVAPSLVRAADSGFEAVVWDISGGGDEFHQQWSHLNVATNGTMSRDSTWHSDDRWVLADSWWCTEHRLLEP